MGLEFSFKTFRCVYSVYQEYRAKGDRSNNTGYTGCKARFTARFVNIASSEEEVPNWCIIAESEYRTHNHLNCGSTHTRVKDIPVDGEVARTDSLLADAKASTKDIGVFLSRQLGRQFTPQQTKNLLKRIGSNMSSHSRCFLTHSHRWKVTKSC
ncbi:hypothetical protein Pcac1_g9477 [Phytophthora cactorum]|nr:hypothetical protein Pcac1_g9477 [Phytophthora cactorum]